MSTSDRHAIVVVDLAFGDCGKGAIIDYLAREHGAHTVVRFNGGPQAGHNVVTPDGRHHTFSQFGSATFLPRVRTLLSHFMLIEPYAMLNEAAHLREVGVPDAMERLFIDERCPVITPVHQAANRIRELSRGAAAHGTCGLGVGETTRDVIHRPERLIRAGDLHDRAIVREKLRLLRAKYLASLASHISALAHERGARHSLETLRDASWFDAAIDNYAEVARRAHIVSPDASRSMLRDTGTTIFEGAQGVLLDETFGFHPYTTWSDTTFANATALLDDARFDGRRTRLGVLRAYFTRHGPGPFVTEDPSLRERLPEPHNVDVGWQGPFRVGVFDAVAARYAISVAGPIDGLALTHLDRVDRLPPNVCTAYTASAGRTINVLPRDGSPKLTDLIRSCRPNLVRLSECSEPALRSEIEPALSLPVMIRSFGPTAHEKVQTLNR